MIQQIPDFFTEQKTLYTDNGWFQKISLHHGRLLEIPEGTASQNLKFCFKKRRVGWGIQSKKNPSMGGVGIFSGTKQYMMKPWAGEQQNSVDL